MTNTTEVIKSHTHMLDLGSGCFRLSRRRSTLMGAVVTALLGSAAKAVVPADATAPQGLTRRGPEGPPSATKQNRAPLEPGYGLKVTIRSANAKAMMPQKVYGPQKFGRKARGR